MGARGKGASPTSRHLSVNARPNPRMRARWVEEGSAGYNDLIARGSDWCPDFWPDPLDPERKLAWEQWGPKIFQRWAYYRNHGRRPSAWWDFDLPGLITRARRRGVKFTNRQIDAMTAVEVIFHFDADAGERQSIEDSWRRDVENWGAEETMEIFDTPRWFVVQEKLEGTPPCKEFAEHVANERAARAENGGNTTIKSEPPAATTGEAPATVVPLAMRRSRG